MSTYTEKRARLLRECVEARRQARSHDTEEVWLPAIRRLMKAQDELLGLRRAAQEWVEKKPPAPSVRRAPPQTAAHQQRDQRA